MGDKKFAVKSRPSDDMDKPPEKLAPDQRECTRCDGQQLLLASGSGMGKYRCDTCEVVICFDLDTHPAEFMRSRGLPKNYTKDIYGENLSVKERRLP